ncbi:MAG: hypothetical protein KC917_04585, partial [Candidatus Omnitrophica bacterium]|nr:hypothetical protein [Candidatus Omnitrophota bacterium]
MKRPLLLFLILELTVGMSGVHGAALEGKIDSTPLAPGGFWPDLLTTHLTLNSTTNRLLTVVKNNSGGPGSPHKILSFDASTYGLASKYALDIPG